jgi:glycosyl-4,4'-diaponeurosporenoate acyltransferase
MAIDVIVWAAIHSATGYFVHRLPVTRLGDGWLYRERRVERGGALYSRTFRIKAWKDRLPEAGALFPGGVSKRSLPDSAVGGLPRFVIETRRAELGHWLAVACSPIFVIWNPWHATVLLTAYGFAANLPCVAIQRYNRLRARRILRGAPAPRSSEWVPPDRKELVRTRTGSSMP